MIKIKYVSIDSTGSTSVTKRADSFQFNDGSVQVKVGESDTKVIEDLSCIYLHARLKSPEDQMALLMTASVLKASHPGVPIDLIMPFTPYGRQDSAFVPGEANAMKVWAGMINSVGFRSVVVLDPHSIGVDHIDNLVVVDILDILQSTPLGKRLHLDEELVLVSPDAGANKKCHKIANLFGMKSLVRADKARDLETGNILETELYGDVSGKECIIIDDICDGGMTFIKLAEKLKAEGASKVVLFVTHGIFSKGVKVFNGLIDEVYTTNTLVDLKYKPEDFDGEFEVFKVWSEG